MSETKRLMPLAFSGTFEPWLGGDRQTEKRVAKARIRCQEGALKSVCRELPRAVLAACGGRVYRLMIHDVHA
ncbi:hypothetical protein [Bradyrhizobium sp.]|uniref:hypothetical protein n=1 Tax=Bradyrhizobium sp. TaxID=376 RepID=UPI0025C01927|nr:hypothetical protein [Bradyrhizobium sp.]